MKLLSKKTKEKKPKFFLEKLFEVLKNKKYDKIISWNNDGTKIVIYNPSKFSRVILPKMSKSKHNNYETFVRELNMYSFNKITKIYNSDPEQFYNENFRKDKEEEDIRKIRRKNTLFEEEDNSAYNKKKELLCILDKIQNEKDENKKIEDYKNLIQDGNMNLLSNTYILEFLINQSKEMADFYNQSTKKLSETKNQSINKLNNIQTFNNSIGINNNNMNGHNILNDSGTFIIDNNNNISNSINYGINNNYGNCNYIINNSLDPAFNLNQSFNFINDNQKNIYDSHRFELIQVNNKPIYQSLHTLINCENM